MKADEIWKEPEGKQRTEKQAARSLSQRSRRQLKSSVATKEGERESLDEYHEPDGTHPMHIASKYEMSRDAQGKTIENDEYGELPVVGGSAFDSRKIKTDERLSNAEPRQHAHLNFTTGENIGAKVLRQELRQITANGQCIDDVSGEKLDEAGVKAARLLEMDFPENGSVYLCHPRTSGQERKRKDHKRKMD